MERTVLKVSGMSCDHCVKAVEGAVSALEGVNSVTVDLVAQVAIMEHSCPVDQIKEAIKEQGFDVE